MAGRISPELSFDDAFDTRPQYFEQGCYARQLERYLRFFSAEQLLILIYEDALKDPYHFIQTIFSFIDVEQAFVPSMIHSKVNVGYVPRAMWFEKFLRYSSATMSRGPLRWIWWNAKKLGFGQKLRSLNAEQTKMKNIELPSESRMRLLDKFSEENDALEALTGTKLGMWKC